MYEWTRHPVVSFRGNLLFVFLLPGLNIDRDRDLPAGLQWNLDRLPRLLGLLLLSFLNSSQQPDARTGARATVIRADFLTLPDRADLVRGENRGGFVRRLLWLLVLIQL